MTFPSAGVYVCVCKGVGGMDDEGPERKTALLSLVYHSCLVVGNREQWVMGIKFQERPRSKWLSI